MKFHLLLCLLQERRREGVALDDAPRTERRALVACLRKMTAAGSAMRNKIFSNNRSTLPQERRRVGAALKHVRTKRDV